ncbi:hypothetical protein GALMADRAFT_158718 [Galerina marginata CBS 339.88]|uniref:AMP-dependent synthetase/ligase domain-containing protein n=1 Tax=Galerina marginata (strain CBS 339.88) TaxID=685588 RepID=A0A067T0H7_GALM3|nr:hypothetical protein GALMADRAFT_158718 [Galerina marginata CBS 339.88]
MTETPLSDHFKVPPLDGSLCVPEVYDWHYIHNADRPIFVYSEREDGPTTYVTYGEFVPALHRAGRLISCELNINADGDRGDYPVVAVLSTADTISTFTLLVGMLRLGIIGFPISPRFSAPVIAHLLQKTGATDVFVSLESPRVHQLARDSISLVVSQSNGEKAEEIRIHPVPLFSDIYRKDLPFEPIRKKNYALSSTALIVHSSNSSSEYPKAIPWSVRMQSQHSTIPAKSSHDLRGVIFSCHSIELFHTLGLFFLFWVPTSGMIMATFKPSSPAVKPTSDLAFTGIQSSKSTYVLTHTRFLEAWSQESSKVAHLRTLKAVLSGGKILKKSVGDFLANQGVSLCNMYGSTECGQISAMPSGTHAAALNSPFTNLTLECDAESQGREWEYFQLNPQCGARFIDQGNSSFHLVVVDSGAQTIPISNTTYMGEDACTTGDVLVPHPTKPNHWKVLGRIDDQIMLCTGEVVNPVQLENLVCASQFVNAAVIFGRSRTHLGVLVELAEPIDTDARVVEKAKNLIWPGIQALNSSSPPHCHISREMIIFVKAEKPLPYNPKGSPKRASVLLQYQQEIDSCYEGAADLLLADIRNSANKNTENISHVLSEALQHSSGPKNLLPGAKALKEVFQSFIARIL